VPAVGRFLTDVQVDKKRRGETLRGTPLPKSKEKEGGRK